jgi:hypothetical protein
MLWVLKTKLSGRIVALVTAPLARRHASWLWVALSGAPKSERDAE